MDGQTPSGGGNGENPVMVIEMGPTQPEQSQESGLVIEGDRLARTLNEIGTTECLSLSILVVSVISFVYVILLIILYYTGII